MKQLYLDAANYEYVTIEDMYITYENERSFGEVDADVTFMSFMRWCLQSNAIMRIKS